MNACRTPLALPTASRVSRADAPQILWSLVMGSDFGSGSSPRKVTRPRIRPVARCAATRSADAAGEVECSASGLLHAIAVAQSEPLRNSSRTFRVFTCRFILLVQAVLPAVESD